jgi:hypothetical protein
VKLPIGFELVLKLRADRDVVGMALDPDLFIVILFNIADLFGTSSPPA